MNEQNHKFLEKWNDADYVNQLKSNNNLRPIAAQIAARMLPEDRPKFSAWVRKQGHEQLDGHILIEKIPCEPDPEYSLCRYLVEK